MKFEIEMIENQGFKINEELIEMYEPHGWFETDEVIIMHGHENIYVYSKRTKETVNQNTRCFSNGVCHPLKK